MTEENVSTGAKLAQNPVVQKQAKKAAKNPKVQKAVKEQVAKEVGYTPPVADTSPGWTTTDSSGKGGSGKDIESGHRAASESSRSSRTAARARDLQRVLLPVHASRTEALCASAQGQ